MSEIVRVDLDCGATLVAEPMAAVESAALCWLLPMGTAGDPHDGDATMLTEMLFRGAGGMSSREHSDALDRLGARRSASAGSYHLRLGMTCLGDRLGDVLDLLVPMVREPALPADAMEPVRSLCLQALDALDDDPQHLVMLRLSEQHLPPPFNRHGYGDRRVLETMTIDDLRRSWQARCRPGGTIIAAAGKIDPQALAARLDDRLAGWTGRAEEPSPTAPPQRGIRNIRQDTSQVHIGVAYDAPPAPHEDTMLERLAVHVLSGGTSARLFTEVRQKRSLCYSVGASYSAGRDRGIVSLYAGTTPERAQETLDVCGQELHRLAEGVSATEMARAVTGLKSRFVMQGESTSSRAGAIGMDLFKLGRPRTLEELAAEVDAVTLDDLNAYVGRREPGELTITSIGPVELGVPASAVGS